jgi:outer membrane protein OmpA-like peptidoglycan-associated protein
MTAGRTVGAAVAAVVALALTPGATSAAAAAPPQDEPAGEARTVELAPRVVDLAHRSAALDDSEQTTVTRRRTTVVFASDVFFATDRSDLTGDARRQIDLLAEDLAELGARTVTIEGHTDDQGEPAYNQRLSERRAEAVRAHFAVQLADSFALEAAGYGETRPVAPNDTDDGRARNRRVVISYPTR